MSTGHKSDNQGVYSAYRRKKFKSDFMNTLHEKYIRSKRHFLDVCKAIGHFSQQKLSLMFVPHSEKRVFDIRFSYLSLLLFSVVLIVVVIFSIISLNEYETTTTKIDHLTRISQDHEASLEIFRNSADYTIQNYSKLERQFEQLSGSFHGETGDKNRMLPFTGLGGVDVPIPQNHTSLAESSIEEKIERVGQLHTEIAENTKEIEKMNSLVENMKNVMHHVPSLWPVVGGGSITSRFGNRADPFTGLETLHTGFDIAWWPGSPIRATASGVVIWAKNLGPYGLCIVVKHKYGFSSRYAHLQSFRVKEGDVVERGQIIGGMGNTGKATGYHLHYEVLLEEQAIDPEPYLTSRF